MGRKEERRKKRLLGESFKKPEMPSDIAPFMLGDTKIIPVHADSVRVPAMPGEEKLMTTEEFRNITHELSDRELNRIIYQNAKDAVANGYMQPRPEDDFGTVMWFTWNFITDEMREAFPAIAKEYLAHYREEDGRELYDIPYPRLNETTWDDAYYYRVLLMMLYSARNGNAYSRNFLLSLYKVYHRQEYNKLKKLKVLTYLDILELHDEACYRQGLKSGHTMDGIKSYRQTVIEKRMHEPGWTNVYGSRGLAPTPAKIPKDMDAEMTKAAAAMVDMSDAPDEPPLQPVASRLIVMSGLMGIPVDETCNEQYAQMNEICDSLLKLTYRNSPEYRKIRSELVERAMGMLKVDWPEMFDPYIYQSNPEYLPLQIAEVVMTDVFKKYDTYIRIPYDSKKFDLARICGELTVTLNMHFPDVPFGIHEVQILALVEYLSECLCELMAARDKELEEVLRFHRRREEGEWIKEAEEESREPASGALAEKALRAVESLHGQAPEPAEEEQVPDDADLRGEVERLKTLLAEKEAALAESEQKVIRQRVLYEKSHERELELERLTDEQSVEHAELIALREYVYNLKSDTKAEEGLDEATREQIAAGIRDKKVAVLGGTERWVKRMKRLLPSWSFVSVEDDSLGGFNSLERADIIYIYTNAVQHAQYYRAMSLIKRAGKMLFYLGSTNTDECLRQFQRELCRK